MDVSCGMGLNMKAYLSEGAPAAVGRGWASCHPSAVSPQGNPWASHPQMKPEVLLRVFKMAPIIVIGDVFCAQAPKVLGATQHTSRIQNE